jgi:hypothetical protein
MEIFEESKADTHAFFTELRLDVDASAMTRRFRSFEEIFFSV